MSRKQWKDFYRLLRVARREARKAYTDMFFYGYGITRIDADTGETMHIPFKDFVIVDLPQVAP